MLRRNPHRTHIFIWGFESNAKTKGKKIQKRRESGWSPVLKMMDPHPFKNASVFSEVFEERGSSVVAVQVNELGLLAKCPKSDSRLRAQQERTHCIMYTGTSPTAVECPNCRTPSAWRLIDGEVDPALLIAATSERDLCDTLPRRPPCMHPRRGCV